MSFWKFSIVFVYLVVTELIRPLMGTGNPLKFSKNQCGIWDIFYPKPKASYAGVPFICSIFKNVFLPILSLPPFKQCLGLVKVIESTKVWELTSGLLLASNEEQFI